MTSNDHLIDYNKKRKKGGHTRKEIYQVKKFLKQTDRLKGNPLFLEGNFFPKGNPRFQPISIFFQTYPINVSPERNSPVLNVV